MPLKTQVGNLEEVDSKYHDLYIQTDTGYKLDADFEDVSGLKSALEKERLNAKTYKKELKKFEGIDVDVYEDLVSKNTDKSQQRWLKQKEELKAQVKERDAKIKNMLLGDTVKKSALEAGINPDDLDDVLKLTSGKFDIVDDEVVVLEDDGTPSTSTVKDFFSTTYKEQRPKFYSGSGKTGSGAFHNLGGGGTKSPDQLYNEAIKSGNLAAAIAIKNQQYKVRQ